MATTSAIFYIVPLGFAQAASTLVGNSLGEGGKKDAQSVVVLGYIIILSFQLLNGSLSMLYKHEYPKLFSNDLAVIQETASLFTMFFVYTVFDGLKAIGMALLRSTGRPTITVLGVFLAQVVIGFPLSFLLRKSVEVKIAFARMNSSKEKCRVCGGDALQVMDNFSGCG